MQGEIRKENVNHIFSRRMQIINRELKHGVNGKRQTAKMKLYGVCCSRLYTKLKIFAFTVNERFFYYFSAGLI